MNIALYSTALICMLVCLQPLPSDARNNISARSTTSNIGVKRSYYPMEEQELLVIEYGPSILTRTIGLIVCLIFSIYAFRMPFTNSAGLTDADRHPHLAYYFACIACSIIGLFFGIRIFFMEGSIICRQHDIMLPYALLEKDFLQTLLEFFKETFYHRMDTILYSDIVRVVRKIQHKKEKSDTTSSNTHYVLTLFCKNRKKYVIDIDHFPAKEQDFYDLKDLLTSKGVRFEDYG